MTTKVKVGLIILAALLLVGVGYGVATWRHNRYIAAADDREKARMAQIAANDAESAKLRTDNDALRKDIATISASEEALKQLVAEHGGAIANEGKKLEEINANLKNDEAVASAPSDSCTRCRRFSANALAAKLIDKPLTCAVECAGSAK